MSWQAIIALAAVGSMLILLISNRRSIGEFFDDAKIEMSRGSRWMLMLLMLYWGAILGQLVYVEGCNMISFLGHEMSDSEGSDQ